MARVIDVDSHWTFSWEFEPEQGPLKRFAGHFPDKRGQLAYFFVGDLIQSLPQAERPRPEQIFPLKPAAADPAKAVHEHWDHLKRDANADDRISWMDRIGIDFALVNPGGYGSLFPLLDDAKVRRDYVSAANDVLAEALDGRSERLSPISVVDLSDLDWAIGELTRMRGRGSRAFSIVTEPVSGLSLAHPHFDRLWAAAVDLGMLVNLHVGNVPGHFGDWARLGWDFDAPQGVGAFVRMANTQRHQGAEHFLNAMVYGGAFERNPKLTVLLSELWTGWLPSFVRQTEVLTAKAGPWGAWPYPLGGADYLRRNVKVSPLPGLGDWDTLDLVRALPEIMVFSSDFPHTEGNADPINLYRPGLDALAPEVQTAFLGATMADCFARTGDPVVAAR